MKNIGIVVIDLQQKFEKCMDNKEELVDNHRTLFTFAKQNEIPIYLLECIGQGETISEITAPITGYKRVEKIKKYNNNAFIAKKRFGEFDLNSDIESPTIIQGDSHLDTTLKEDGIESLIITGLNKHSCVQYTTQEAINRGYEIFTAEDLMNQRKIGTPYYKNNTHSFKKTRELVKHLKSE